jgi:hypothetical protein
MRCPNFNLLETKFSNFSFSENKFSKFTLLKKLNFQNVVSQKLVSKIHSINTLQFGSFSLVQLVEVW